jgi:hypothetical protein
VLALVQDVVQYAQLVASQGGAVARLPAPLSQASAPRTRLSPHAALHVAFAPVTGTLASVDALVYQPAWQSHVNEPVVLLQRLPVPVHTPPARHSLMSPQTGEDAGTHDGPPTCHCTLVLLVSRHV